MSVRWGAIVNPYAHGIPRVIYFSAWRSFVFPHVLLFEISVVLCIEIVYVFTIYSDYVFFFF